jgi:hypothetical protein
VVATDRQLNFLDAALESNEILLQQCLLLLDTTNLVLQFHILDLLLCKVSLELVLNSSSLVKSNLPLGLELQGFPHLS